MELWKDIKNYEGHYKVSTLGNVKSLKSNILLAGTKATQYLTVTLCKNGDMTNYHRHRLVAEAFIPNPLNKPQVNHIDGNKHNNRVENLEWVTHRENMKHAYECGVREYKETRRVLQFGLNGEFIKEYETIHDATKEGFSHSHIIGCCRGRRNEHKGFVWVYADEADTVGSRVHRVNNKLYRSMPVIQLDLDGKEVARFESIKKAAKQGINRNKIASCCKGKREQAGGFKWEYIRKEEL